MRVELVVFVIAAWQAWARPHRPPWKAGVHSPALAPPAPPPAAAGMKCAILCCTALPPEWCSRVRESQGGSVNSQDSWGERTGSGHLWLGQVGKRVNLD